jgi:hypothetical protein
MAGKPRTLTFQLFSFQISFTILLIANVYLALWLFIRILKHEKSLFVFAKRGRKGGWLRMKKKSN